MSAGKRRTVAQIGDVFAIPLEGGDWGYGQVSGKVTMAFFDFKSQDVVSAAEVTSYPVLWRLWVSDKALLAGKWKVLANLPVSDDLKGEPRFFKQDVITGALSIYQDGKEWPAKRSECEGLERAAVWSDVHLVERLNDHFAGRPNRVLKTLRIED